MFNYFAWRAGYCIGRFGCRLRKTLVHFWDHVWFEALMLERRLKLARFWNALCNLIIVIMIWVTVISCLQSEIDLKENLFILVNNIMAAYLYEKLKKLVKYLIS